MLLLIFCFPLGLIAMWSDRCHWSRTVKSAVSMFVAAALVAVVLPQTLPPERAEGGIRLVGREPEVDVFGPEAPEACPTIEIYSPRHTAVVVTVTEPTPVPVMVYCNTGGRYYHAAGCKYVKDTSANVSLTVALNAGYSQCPECDAPGEYDP